MIMAHSFGPHCSEDIIICRRVALIILALVAHPGADSGPRHLHAVGRIVTGRVASGVAWPGDSVRVLTAGDKMWGKPMGPCF